MRRGFSPAGSAVNRAAKLLTLPDLPPVVCDEATARAIDYRIQVHPIGVTVPLGMGDTRLFAASIAEAGNADLGPDLVIGRDHEVRALLRHVDALTGPAARSGIVTIEGEAGIGKNNLAQLLRHRVTGRLLDLHCIARQTTAATPLAALAPVFAALFAPEVAAGREAVLRAATAILRERLIDPAHVALAATVLPLPLGPGPRTLGLAPADAARAERDVLLALLEDRIAERPAMVLIEEAHWLDLVSWSLIDRAAGTLPRVLFVLTARPSTDAEWPGFDAVLDVPPTERLVLARWMAVRWPPYWSMRWAALN